MMKRKFLLLVCAVLTSVSMSADVDITSYLGDISTYSNSNGGWDDTCDNNHTSTNDGAWWNTQTLTGGHSFRYYNGAYESWTASAGTAGVVMGRTITLPTGSYNLSFKAVGTSQSGNTTANDVVAFCTGKENISISTTGEKDYNTKYDVSFDFEITGESATIQFGIKKLSDESTYNWFTLDELVLKFKTTSTDQTSLITNPDFSDTTWGNGWSGVGTDKTKVFVKKTGGSSFDGNCAEMYGKSLTAADLKQTITNLPAGIYTLLAKVKAGITCSLYASIGGKEQKHSCLSDLSVQKLSFIVSKTSDVTIGLKHAGYSSDTDNAWIAVDGFKLLRVGDVDETELTSQIANWDFMDCEGAWGVETKFPGWDVSNPYSGNAWRNSATTVEYWIASASSGSFDYYQSVTGLPNGKYTLSASMWNSTNSEGGTASVGGECGVYGTSSHGTVFKGVTDDCDNTNLHTYTTNGILVTDGTLRVGVKNDKTMKARWFGVDWIKLKYISNAISDYSPDEFTSGEATKDTWYASTVGSAGYYKISSETAATIRYTQDNSNDADTGGETLDLAAGAYTVMNLSAGTFYFKSDVNSNISIETLTSTNGTDVTFFISNPSFEEGNTDGWTPGKDVGLYLRSTQGELSNKVGTYYALIQKNGTRSVSQTISSLPKGMYILSVNAKADTDAGTVSLNMGTSSSPIPSNATASIYTVAYEAEADDASAEIKISGTEGSGTSRRCYFDNFTLTYYTTLPDVSISDLLNSAMDGSVRAALKSASATYNDSKTVANYNALQTAIINAKNSIASPSANNDYTDYIANPSFETGYKLDPVTGWTVTVTSGSSTNANSRYKGDNNNAEGKADGGSGYVLGFGEDGGNIRFSLWTENAGAGSVSQTLHNLPAGNYKLSAYMATGSGSTLTLSADDASKTIIATSSAENLVEVYFTQASRDDVVIKATCNSSWFDVDNFKLTYEPTLPSSITGESGDMNATVASTQSTAVSAYNEDNTFEKMLTAQTAMNAAVASELVYTNIKNNIQASYATKAASLDDAGKDAYETAINTTTTGAEWKYDNGVYETAAEAETAFHNDYVTAVKAQTTENTDMTEAITNPSFETNDFTGWTNNGMKTQNNASYDGKDGTYYAEQWQTTGIKSVSQDLSGLHSGEYRLTASAYSGDATSKLYVTIGGTEYKTDVTTSDDYSVTFNYDGVSALTIGFEGDMGSDSNTGWICVDNFRLTYIGTAAISDLAQTLPNDGAVDAKKWYSIFIPTAGNYYITSPSAATITYSQDGTAASETGTALSFSEGEQKSVELSAGTLYMKSSVAQSIAIDMRFYLATDVDGETKWLNKNNDGYTYAYDYGIPFTLERGTGDTYKLKFSEGNYLNDVGYNWQTKAIGTNNDEWVLSPMPEGKYKLLLGIDNSCELVVINKETGLIEMTHNSPKGSEWQFVQPATVFASAFDDAKTHTIGFEAGEYAPYNNVAAVTALNTANAATTTDEKISAYAALGAASWTVNDGEVNAFCGGDFTQYETISSKDYPYGWNLYNGADNHSRIMGGSEGGGDNNKGLSATSSGKALLLKYNATYGETEGYTMPLKAGKIYKITFKHGRWAEANPRITNVIMTDPDGTSITLAPGFQAATDDCQNEGGVWYTYTGYFVSTTEGNYKFNFEKTLTDQGRNTQMQIAIADIDLRTAEYIEFADGSVPTYAPGTYPSVKITRSLTADRWATAVYPFAVSGVDKIAVLDNYNTETQHIRFVSAAASTANEPFLMRSTTSKSEINLSDVEVEATAANPKVTSNNLSFIGSYSEVAITNAQNNYVLSANTIYPVGTAGATIPAFRAYLQDANSYAARSLKFVVDDEVTAIEGISNKNDVDGTVYNLNGQVVRKNASTLDGLKKGVYIVNGQRVIVK